MRLEKVSHCDIYTMGSEPDCMPVPCDCIKLMDLCSSLYPASYVEMMKSSCVLAPVATNKSSPVRVMGLDVLIALLI